VRCQHTTSTLFLLPGGLGMKEDNKRVQKMWVPFVEQRAQHFENRKPLASSCIVRQGGFKFKILNAGGAEEEEAGHTSLSEVVDIAVFSEGGGAAA